MTMVAPGGIHDGQTAAALTAALAELADASDALTMAVERHDIAELVAATGRAEELSTKVDTIAGRLAPADRAGLDPARIGALQERLATAARRNAYLIERAWALDAATMRLLVGLARTDDGAAYGAATATITAPPAPVAGAGSTWLDRQA